MTERAQIDHLIRCLEEEERILAQWAQQQRPALYAAVAFLLEQYRADGETSRENEK